MKVSELIKILSTLDPEIQVFTNGYEGGLTLVELAENPPIHKITLDYYSPNEWWYGRHEYSKITKGSDQEKEVMGIIL